jgi:hypothetical protein
MSAAVASARGATRTYLDDLLEQLEDKAIELNVLETSLLGFCQGGADGEGDDNIVGVLRCAVVDCQSFSTGYT